jgi:hypothetical protein
LPWKCLYFWIWAVIFPVSIGEVKHNFTFGDFLKSFFKKLGHDRACNIKLILVTLSQYLVHVCNPAVTKTEKLHIRNNFTLQQVAALYAWKGNTETKSLQGKGTSENCKVSRHPKNMAKNHYGNIIPRKSTEMTSTKCSC